MKVDLHVHTCYSFDNFTPMEQTIAAIKKSGVDCVAITDHNEIAGAFEMQERALFDVIIGEEIRTAEGEIIGLFMKEKIPGGLPARRTVQLIREQGGLVYLPHPFCWLLYSRLKNRLVWEFVREGLVDIVEVYNASAITLMPFKQVHELLASHPGVAAAASTDAHLVPEFVGACTEMEKFNDPADFLTKIKKGKLQMKPGYLYAGVQLIYNYFIRTKLFKMPHGESLKRQRQIV